MNNTFAALLEIYPQSIIPYSSMIVLRKRAVFLNKTGSNGWMLAEGCSSKQTYLDYMRDWPSNKRSGNDTWFPVWTATLMLASGCEAGRKVMRLKSALLLLCNHSGKKAALAPVEFHLNPHHQLIGPERLLCLRN
jgi:hypothetical protein